MPDVIWRLSSVQWNGLPVASLAVFVVGGVMYAAMFTRSTNSSITSVPVRQPGRIARHVLEKMRATPPIASPGGSSG
jgi:hypothetical protein